MRSSLRFVTACASAVVALAACGTRDAARTPVVSRDSVTLPPATAGIGALSGELARTMSKIGSIAELPDGRVVVVDEDERLLLLADFDAQRVVQLGRKGAGPREYGGMLGIALPMAGDSIWVTDWANSRFLVISPGGELLGTTVPLAPGIPPTVSAADADGHVYWMTRRAGVDTQHVRRADPRAGRADSPVRLAVPHPQTTKPAHSGPRQNEERVAVATVQINPYQSEDAWGVFPNGDIITVRAKPYHAEIFTRGGDHIGGPEIPFQSIEVSERIERSTASRRCHRSFLQPVLARSWRRMAHSGCVV